MRIVVVAGQARKVGKTSVMTALIRATRRLNWVAVKISTHEGPAPQGIRPNGIHGAGDTRFELTEAKEASPFTDTGRYLAAGARRAFWLRARPDGLKDGVAALLAAIGNDPNVMIESGSVLSILKPEVTILVVDRKRREVKPSFRRALTGADAVVHVASVGSKPAGSPPFPSSARRFVVARHNWYDTELGQFVLHRFRRTQDA